MQLLSRRDLLANVGRVFAGAAVGSLAPAISAAGGSPADGTAPGSLSAVTAATSPYGTGFDPPAKLNARSLDRLTRPPSASGPGPTRLREVDLWVSEQSVAVGEGLSYSGWTYNGTVPGPVLRASQGDLLDIRFRNLGAHPHNVHFHGRHSVSQDGWQPIAPGESERYSIDTEVFGLFPYHCHAMPVSEHVARGLYGTLIVDPAEGRAPAHELSLVLSAFDIDGDGRNDVYAWNGVAGYFARFPIKVPVGELVRVYLTNMVPGEAVGSFHLHAETFDVIRSGSKIEPDEHTDVVTLGHAERAVLEFRLPERGRFMFHPHQVHMAERGAMGWFAAI